MKKSFKKPKVYDKTQPKKEIKQEELQKKALDVVLKVFPEQKDKQLKWKDIHNGYTNFSYIVTFENGKQYQVRLPHDPDVINRLNEYDILFNYLKSDKFPYFDQKTGIAIKKWITGNPPKRHIYKKHWFIEDLFTKIKKLHATEIKKSSKFKPIKFDAYNENLYRLRFAFKRKFLTLLDKRRNDPVVLNHTDINPLNIVFNKENKAITLIDYEWAGLASDYFDYANFVRETGIKYDNVEWKKYIPNFDMQIFKEYLFMASVYSFLWTYIMPQTPKILKYRTVTYKQIKKYYPGVVTVDKSNYITENNENK